MDEKKIEVLPNHKEISKLANELYGKQDEFDLSNPYEVGYVLINKLGYRKESDTAREILQAVDNESNGQTVAVTNVLRKRYGVKPTEDTTANIKND